MGIMRVDSAIPTTSEPHFKFGVSDAGPGHSSRCRKLANYLFRYLTRTFLRRSESAQTHVLAEVRRDLYKPFGR